MVYIIASLLRKAYNKYDRVLECKGNVDDMWKTLMLTPLDFSKAALFNETTRIIMDKIEFAHGGVEYDTKYPEGIPTSVEIRTKEGKVYDSGMIMYPAGHARNETAALHDILQHKFKILGKMALDKQELIKLKVQLENIGEMSNEELQELYDCKIKFTEESIDSDDFNYGTDKKSVEDGPATAEPTK